jgi:transposase
MRYLDKIEPGVAAIDIGRERLYVAVAEQPVKNFGTFTSELRVLAAYLQAHGVQQVAMEATGVYWIPVHDYLEQQGLKVTLFNGQQARNMPGRKSDVADCQWHAMLHSHGLLTPCFVPSLEIRQLRSYYRLRDDHISMAASHIQHMHKALDLMNIGFHRVISQLQGVSGLRVVEAILAGERDPQRLLELCDAQIIKRKREAVLLSLEGDWQEHHLFALGQALTLYKMYQEQIRACDQQIERLLQRLNQGRQPQSPKPGRTVKPVRHNAPAIEDLHGELVTLCEGRDPTQIGGLGQLSFLKLVGELGPNLDAWPTKKHFTRWLGLAPGKHTSGKQRRQRVWQPKTRAGQIFRESAMSVTKGHNLALNAFYRRLKARRGPAIAFKAVARKLAEYYYDVMTKGIEYVELGLQRYEQKYQQQSQAYVRKLAAKCGLAVVPLAQTATP